MVLGIFPSLGREAAVLLPRSFTGGGIRTKVSGVHNRISFPLFQEMNVQKNWWETLSNTKSLFLTSLV